MTGVRYTMYSNGFVYECKNIVIDVDIALSVAINWGFTQSTTRSRGTILTRAVYEVQPWRAGQRDVIDLRSRRR